MRNSKLRKLCILLCSLRFWSFQEVLTRILKMLCLSHDHANTRISSDKCNRFASSKPKWRNARNNKLKSVYIPDFMQNTFATNLSITSAWKGRYHAIAEIINIYYLHVSNPCGVREQLLLKKYFAKTYDSKIKLSYLKELL